MHATIHLLRKNGFASPRPRPRRAVSGQNAPAPRIRRVGSSGPQPKACGSGVGTATSAADSARYFTALGAGATRSGTSAREGEQTSAARNRGCARRSSGAGGPGVQRRLTESKAGSFRERRVLECRGQRTLVQGRGPGTTTRPILPCAASAGKRRDRSALPA